MQAVRRTNGPTRASASVTAAQTVGVQMNRDITFYPDRRSIATPQGHQQGVIRLLHALSAGVARQPSGLRAAGFTPGSFGRPANSTPICLPRKSSNCWASVSPTAAGMCRAPKSLRRARFARLRLEPRDRRGSGRKPSGRSLTPNNRSGCPIRRGPGRLVGKFAHPGRGRAGHP